MDILEILLGPAFVFVLLVVISGGNDAFRPVDLGKRSLFALKVLAVLFAVSLVLYLIGAWDPKHSSLDYYR